MSHTPRLQVSIDDQKLRLLDADGQLREFLISTAAKGVGSQEGSHRTPTGHFRIAEKIGEGCESGTIFKSRVPSGVWSPDSAVGDDDLILSRILRIEGQTPENANTFNRYIYLHGTNREDLLGTPASHGCIRMSNRDIIELFNLVDPGTPLEIIPPTRPRGKLFFVDCDSTLSTIEGIDELARARGESVFQDVVALTNAAMNGEIPLDEVFPRRMEIIRPDRDACEQVARLYLETITPGSRELITKLKQDGWTPVILSGGFAPLIQPLARELGIDHVEAVPLMIHENGTYSGYGNDYPTTRNGGKNEIIREWKAALLPERVIMMGDGASDLETQPDVNLFVGYGGVVQRPKVKAGADVWIEQMAEFATVSF
jgi:phosphoserine phosphatase